MSLSVFAGPVQRPWGEISVWHECIGTRPGQDLRDDCKIIANLSAALFYISWSMNLNSVITDANSLNAVHIDCGASLPDVLIISVGIGKIRI